MFMVSTRLTWSLNLFVFLDECSEWSVVAIDFFCAETEDNPDNK